jgi:hypothetical protein
VKEYVVERLNGYPLCWGMAEAATVGPTRLERGANAAESLQTNVLYELTSKVQPYFSELVKVQPSYHMFTDALHRRKCALKYPPLHYERNLIEVEGTGVSGFLLRAIFPEALDVLQEAFPLTSAALNRIPRPDAFECSVLTILSTLAPVGSAALTTIRLSGSCFTFNDLPTPSKSGDVACVMATCPRAQFVDMYALRVSKGRVELLVVQCTLNDTHLDSFESFRTEGLAFLNGKTMLQRCIELLTIKYCSNQPIVVNFIWVTQVTSEKGDHTAPWNSPKKREHRAPGNSLLKLLLEATQSTLYRNETITLDTGDKLLNLHLPVHFEAVRGKATSILDSRSAL